MRGINKKLHKTLLSYSVSEISGKYRFTNHSRTTYIQYAHVHNKNFDMRAQPSTSAESAQLKPSCPYIPRNYNCD